jgi:hypothetical protein
MNPVSTPVVVPLRPRAVVRNQVSPNFVRSAVSYDEPSAKGRQQALEAAGATDIAIVRVKPGQRQEWARCRGFSNEPRSVPTGASPAVLGSVPAEARGRARRLRTRVCLALASRVGQRCRM